MLLKKINNIKIITKINVIIAIFCVAMLTGEMWSRKIVYDAYNEQVYITTAQLLTSYVSHLEAEIEKIDNLTLAMIGDNTLQRNLSVIAEADNDEKYGIMRDIKYQLSSYKEMLDHCEILALWLPTGEYSLEYKILKEDQVQSFVNHARTAEGSLVMIPDEQDVWFSRQIRQIENLSLIELGVLFYKVDFTDLMHDISLFFNLINGIIGSLQAFNSAFLVTAGGPMNSTLYYALYQYNQAFKLRHMGYASAMAWFLMLVIVALTAIVFKSQSAWVYYQDES